MPLLAATKPQKKNTLMSAINDDCFLDMDNKYLSKLYKYLISMMIT